MSWKLRAEAASSPPDTNVNGPGKPAGVRKHGTERAKNAPQKCAERRPKVVKKTSKTYKKAAQMRQTNCTKNMKKACFFELFCYFFDSI